MEKTIGILTFEQFHGRQNIGSSRIRVKWPLQYWPEAEEFCMGAKYEVVIFQKAYWLEYAKKFEGIKILDICDADWLHWGYRIKEMIDHCDAITTSTLEQAKYLVKLTDKPVWCIPDRLDFASFGSLKKDHKNHGKAKSVAWFGYSENFPMLEAAVNSLIQVGLEELIVIADRRSPYMLPPSIENKIRLINYPWTAETCNQDLLRADMIVNPIGKNGRWKYKSNNKTIHGWALGMPVALNKEDLEKFMDEEARVKEGEYRYNYVREKYPVQKSVEEYKNLIKELKANRLLQT